MQTERQMAANPQTKPTELACESTSRLLPSTSTTAIYYYYLTPNPKADIHCTVPKRVEG